MSEKIDQISGIAASFLETLKEDPLKAAGLIALGYVAIQVTVVVLKTVWRLKWAIAAVLVVVGVAYVMKPGADEAMRIEPDEPVEPIENLSVNQNDVIQEEI